MREPRRLDLVDRAGQPLHEEILDFVRRARVTVGVVVHTEELLALVASQPQARRRRLYEAVDLLQGMRKRDAGRFREVVGPVMSPWAGPSMELWTQELARRIRLDEAPERPLEALARGLPDEREVIWATL